MRRQTTVSLSLRFGGGEPAVHPSHCARDSTIGFGTSSSGLCFWKFRRSVAPIRPANPASGIEQPPTLWNQCEAQIHDGMSVQNRIDKVGSSEGRFSMAGHVHIDR